VALALTRARIMGQLLTPFTCLPISRDARSKEAEVTNSAQTSTSLCTGIVAMVSSMSVHHTFSPSSPLPNNVEIDVNVREQWQQKLDPLRRTIKMRR